MSKSTSLAAAAFVAALCGVLTFRALPASQTLTASSLRVTSEYYNGAKRLPEYPAGLANSYTACENLRDDYNIDPVAYPNFTFDIRQGALFCQFKSREGFCYSHDDCKAEVPPGADEECRMAKAYCSANRCQAEFLPYSANKCVSATCFDDGTYREYPKVFCPAFQECIPETGECGQSCRTDDDCSDLDYCTEDTCDTDSGQCAHVQKPNCECSKNDDCNDQNNCTPDDRCDLRTNTCEFQEPTPNCCQQDSDCEDNDSCTTDSCEGGVNGAPGFYCTHEQIDGCFNGERNECETDAECQGGIGSCVSGVCGTDHRCTLIGYTDGRTCNDGNPTTGKDHCTTEDDSDKPVCKGTPCPLGAYSIESNDDENKDEDEGKCQCPHGSEDVDGVCLCENGNPPDVNLGCNTFRDVMRNPGWTDEEGNFHAIEVPPPLPRDYFGPVEESPPIDPEGSGIFHYENEDENGNIESVNVAPNDDGVTAEGFTGGQQGNGAGPGDGGALPPAFGDNGIPRYPTPAPMTYGTPGKPSAPVVRKGNPAKDFGEKSGTSGGPCDDPYFMSLPVDAVCAVHETACQWLQYCLTMLAAAQHPPRMPPEQVVQSAPPIAPSLPSSPQMPLQPPQSVEAPPAFSEPSMELFVPVPPQPMVHPAAGDTPMLMGPDGKVIYAVPFAPSPVPAGAARQRGVVPQQAIFPAPPVPAEVPEEQVVDMPVQEPARVPVQSADVAAANPAVFPSAQAVDAAAATVKKLGICGEREPIPTLSMPYFRCPELEDL